MLFSALCSRIQYTYYTFSARSMFSASGYKKIATKNIEENENEQPEEEEYFTFEALIFPEFSTFFKTN